MAPRRGMTNEELSKKIVDLRDKQNLTFEIIARRLGASRDYVSRLYKERKEKDKPSNGV